MQSWAARAATPVFGRRGRSRAYLSGVARRRLQYAVNFFLTHLLTGCGTYFSSTRHRYSDILTSFDSTTLDCMLLFFRRFLVSAKFFCLTSFFPAHFSLQHTAINARLTNAPTQKAVFPLRSIFQTCFAHAKYQKQGHPVQPPLWWRKQWIGAACTLFFPCLLCRKNCKYVVCYWN